MAKETRRIGSFLAIDANGGQHVLDVYQVFIQSRLLSGQVMDSPGIRSIFTEDGGHVNRLAEGEYEVVTSGLRLHSSDPAAV